MSSSAQRWQQWGGVLLLALALVGLVVLLMPHLWGSAAGPEVELMTALKRVEREGLQLSIAGSRSPLTSQKLYYSRIVVRVDPHGQRAEALATLDFTGRMDRTAISSLGVELVPFVKRGWSWELEGTAAPRLVAAVQALEARRQALERGDRQALARLLARVGDGGMEEGVGAESEQVLAVRRRRYEVEAWYLRLEREEAVASELWRLEGSLPDRPVDQKGQRQLLLIRQGEQFLFSPSLM